MEKAKENLELITRYFSKFSETQLRQLEALADLYKEWNSRINVISRKDDEGFYEKHVLHSLSIAAVFDLQDGMNILDLGTGGGFPGIPLAIFFPDVKFHLADSIGKKIKVVESIAGELALKNIITAHTRVEEIKNMKFDSIVSRAVAPLKELWKWSRPLLNTSTLHRGHSATVREALPVPYGLICLKGGDLAKEIAESGCKPSIMEITEIFSGTFFQGKFILYIPSGN